MAGNVHKSILIVAAAISAASLASAQTYKPNYSEKIEADNGAVYMVELNYVSRFSPGTIKALIYDQGRGGVFAMLFDCRGNGAEYGQPLAYLPPRSVGARLATIACAEAARNKR